MNIVALSGSLRKDSFNTKLLHGLQAIAPSGMQITIVGIGEVPLFNQERESSFPPAAQAFKDAIQNADGIIISTPEYNRSVPGVLKNAIDWASRPWGKNAFAGKPVLIMGVSSGKVGAAIAQSHLRQVLAYLDTRTVTQPELYLGPATELFDAAGALAQDSTKELLRTALGNLSKLAA